MLLVQVGVVHGPGKGEVVRGVKCVPRVQIEHHVIARLLPQLGELGLEPAHGVIVGDVKQGGDRYVLKIYKYILYFDFNLYVYLEPGESRNKLV